MRFTHAVPLKLLVLCFAFGQSYTISTFAGGQPHPSSKAKDAAIGNPSSVTVDASGNLYFFSRNCIFKVDTAGVLTRIAGNYTSGYSGDGGPATSAQIHPPSLPDTGFGSFQVYANLAVDKTGNVYIPDPLTNRVRKGSPAGIITT